MFYPEAKEKESHLEDTSKGLYSRDFDSVLPVKSRHNLKQKVQNIGKGWSDEDLKKESSFRFPYFKVLVVAVIFFIIAIIFASFRFFGGGNMISGDNIDILVRGPVSVAGGEVLPLDVEIKNKNNVDLKVVDMKILYPDGTRSPEDLSTPLIRYNEIIGDINSGKTEKRLVKSVLFGEENIKKDIKFTVEYRIPGSNAIFYKEKLYTVLINSSPINLIVTGVDEVSANQQTDFNVEIVSNSLSVIKNLILKADYPFGFNFVSSDPRTSSIDNSVWSIGDLEPGAKRTIKFAGVIGGQDGEERVFRFTVGTPDKLDEKTINTAFSVHTLSVLIKKPFLGVNLFINGDPSKEVVVDSGSKINVGLNWQNNLPTNVYDAVIKVKLSGLVFDKASVRAEKGFYSSIDNTVIFDKQKDPAFSSIEPGYMGENSFDFATFNAQSKTGLSFSNSQVTLDISVYGNRVQGSNVPQELLYSATKKVKVASVLRLSANAFRSIGPFENSGPLPPRSEQESTYTITWSATNLLNDVSQARVSAVLPSYVKWNGLTSPLNEKIYYNESTREVAWDIGNIKGGTGTTYYPREVSFHITFTPSLSQVSTSPELVGGATITGLDTYTGTQIGESRPAVTTEIINDPAFKAGDNIVVE